VLEEVLEAQHVYRRARSTSAYPEEAELLSSACAAASLRRCYVGPRPIGMLGSSAPSRRVHAAEVELVSLLGRLAATRVQNIRAYEAERSTVEELRRLSALRADFVSLVSHELRSPMAP
jgi:GAF domain-containing protein